MSKPEETLLRIGQTITGYYKQLKAQELTETRF